jgi:hypothetical protein
MRDNTRRYGRFDTELKARYCMVENEGDWHPCTVVNLSRKGIGIQLNVHETLALDTVIRLEVFIPEKSQPTSLKGIVKWTDAREDSVFCGVESIELLDEMKFSKID